MRSHIAVMVLVGAGALQVSPPPTTATTSLQERQDIESYRLARSMAARERFDRALELLAAELERGLDPSVVLRDAIWDPLRPLRRFRELIGAATLGAEGWIAPEGEPGEPFVLELRVTGPDGTSAAGIDVYAYQTDATGLYSETDDNRNPRLFAFARTDARGTVTLHTIVPASYPDSRVTRHVHLEIDGRRWVGEILFDDDPLLDTAGRRRAAAAGWPVVSVADGRATATIVLSD